MFKAPRIAIAIFLVLRLILSAAASLSVETIQNVTISNLSDRSVGAQGINSTSASSLSSYTMDSNDVQITCFQPSEGIKLFPTDYNDCYRAIQNILATPFADYKETWSTSDNPKFRGNRVPYLWEPIRSCRASLGIEYGLQEGEDDFAPRDVANVVTEITAACTRGQRRRSLRLGGTALVGPKRIMRVTVLGVEVKDAFVEMDNFQVN